MRIKEFESKIYSLDDEEFIKYIQKNFVATKAEDKIRVLNNINTLNYLNKNTRIILMARLEKLEHGFEFSTVFSILGGFVLALVASYNTLLKEVNIFLKIESYHSAFWGFILIVLISVFFSYQIGKMRGKKNIAIYFKRLLEKL